MLRLICKSLNEEWGKKGDSSLVGQIFSNNHSKKDLEEINFHNKFWAELSIGDNSDAPTMVLIE